MRPALRMLLRALVLPGIALIFIPGANHSLGNLLFGVGFTLFVAEELVHEQAVRRVAKVAAAGVLSK